MASTFDDWTASLSGDMSPEGRAFLRRVFEDHGPVARDVALRIGVDHQLALAREAVGLLSHDVAATTELAPPSFEYRDDEGSIRLAIWGRYATEPVVGLSQADVTVEVADFVQHEVMEDLHAPWPECLRHRAGLHPSVSADRAVWTCREGRHEVADIGDLRTSSGVKR